MAVSINGTSGLTFNDGTSVGTASSLGMRNRIINGAMEIDQRNAGASVTISASGYTLDRWNAGEDTDGVMTCQQDTVAPSGFINSIKITTTTADTSLSATQYARLLQRIEGLNVADLAWGTASAKPVTLSFWVRCSLTGTFGGSLRNNANNRSYPFSYTISAANTWEYKTVAIPGDTTGTWLTNNGIGVILSFSLGCGSTYAGTANAWAGSDLLTVSGETPVIGTNGATFYLTGVQLEVGSVATPFERRLYGQELALCQRYYQWVPFSMGFTANGNGHFLQVQVPFQVQMRAVPSFATISTDPNSTSYTTNNGSNTFNASYSSVNHGFASLTASAAGSSQVLGYRSAASAEL